MYVYHDIVASFRKHIRRGEEIIITCSGCVSVILVIQHAMRMLCIVICGVLFYHIFPHCIINYTIFRKQIDIKGVL